MSVPLLYLRKLPFDPHEYASGILKRQLALLDARDFVSPKPKHLPRMQTEKLRAEARNLFESTKSRPSEVGEGMENNRSPR